MDLNTWIEKEDMSNIDLAKMIGVTDAYVSMLRNKKRRPSPEVAKSLEKISLGKLKFADLLFPD